MMHATYHLTSGESLAHLVVLCYLISKKSLNKEFIANNNTIIIYSAHVGINGTLKSSNSNDKNVNCRKGPSKYNNFNTLLVGTFNIIDRSNVSLLRTTSKRAVNKSSNEREIYSS